MPRSARGDEMAKKKDHHFQDPKLAELLSGKEGKKPDKLKKDLRLIGHAIENPMKFPLLVKEVADVKKDRNLRLALISVQVDADLHMNQDLQKYRERKYIAKTIERILFGDSVMDGGVMLDEDKNK